MRDATSWVNWQSAMYVFVLGWVCVLLVPLTDLWWIALVCGMATPFALAMLDRSGLTPEEPEDGKEKERELLRALADRGELTPTTAAMNLRHRRRGIEDAREPRPQRPSRAASRGRRCSVRPT